MAQPIFVKPNLDGSYTAYTEGPNGSSSTTAPYRRVSKKSRLNNPNFSSSSVFDLTGVEENEARRLFEAEERKLGLNQKEPKLKKTKQKEKKKIPSKIIQDDKPQRLVDFVYGNSSGMIRGTSDSSVSSNSTVGIGEDDRNLNINDNDDFDHERERSDNIIINNNTTIDPNNKSNNEKKNPLSSPEEEIDNGKVAGEEEVAEDGSHVPYRKILMRKRKKIEYDENVSIIYIEIYIKHFSSIYLPHLLSQSNIIHTTFKK